MLTIRWSDAVEATFTIVVAIAAIFPIDLRNDRTVRPIPAAMSISELITYVARGLPDFFRPTTLQFLIRTFSFSFLHKCSLALRRV